MRNWMVSGLAIALCACAAGGAPAPASVPRTPAAAPAAPGSFRGPPMPSDAVTGAVIGARAGTLLQRFGKARLDLTEGDARKLQFAGQTCVLDIFLYPAAAGAEPRAAYIEARSRKDGSDIDPSACIREVEALR